MHDNFNDSSRLLKTFSDLKCRVWLWKHKVPLEYMEFPSISLFRKLKKGSSPNWYKIEGFLLFHSCLCLMYRIQLLFKNIIFEAYDEFSHLMEQSAFVISNISNHIALYSECNEFLEHIISHFSMVALLDATTNLIIIKHYVSSCSDSTLTSNMKDHVNIIEGSLLSQLSISDKFISYSRDGSDLNFYDSICLQILLNMDSIHRQERIFKNASLFREYLNDIYSASAQFDQESTLDFSRRCYELYITKVKTAWTANTSTVHESDINDDGLLPSTELQPMTLSANDHERFSMLQYIKFMVQDGV